MKCNAQGTPTTLQLSHTIHVYKITYLVTYKTKNKPATPVAPHNKRATPITEEQPWAMNWNRTPNHKLNLGNARHGNSHRALHRASTRQISAPTARLGLRASRSHRLKGPRQSHTPGRS